VVQTQIIDKYGNFNEVPKKFKKIIIKQLFNILFFNYSNYKTSL